MSKTDDGEPDVAALEARIDALEEQYSDETVSDGEGNRISLGGLLNSGLSRRQALKTMALVVSGATLTGAMTQSVAAQNAITGIDQLGEIDDRIGTIYAEDIDTNTFTQSTQNIDAESITTDDATIGSGTPYPFVSNAHTTVTVPGDYSTIQAAVDAAPKRLRHEYIIDVADGHSEGHVKIRGHSQEGFSTGNRGFGVAGENYQLQILGNESDPSQVKIDSFSAVGCVGVETPQVWGVEFQGVQNPDVDEDVCVNVSGSTEVFIGDSSFAAAPTARAAVQSYTSRVNLRNVDIGSDEFQDGVTLKRNAFVTAQDLSGSVTDYAYQATQASEIYQQGSQIAGDLDIRKGSQIYDEGGPRTNVSGALGLTSDQTIANDDTWAGVAFDSRLHGEEGETVNTTESRLLAPEDGTYLIEFSGMFLSADSGERYEAHVRKNGSFPTEKNTDTWAAGAGDVTFGECVVVEASAGDYFETNVKHSNSSNTDIYGSPTYTRTSITRL